MSDRLRIAIAGTSRRSDYLYAPLLDILRHEVEFVGVWGRSENKARSFGAKFQVPWFTDLASLRDCVQPDAIIVSVAGQANGEVGRRVVELGCHALLETPIAYDLAEADALIASAETKGLKVEVAEQYYRRPMERIKGCLIRAGVFGRVLAAYNDFMGHGYHGVSLIRSYVGFDVPVRAVHGLSTKFAVAPHHAWIAGVQESRSEEWEHGVLHFENGSMGFFSWSSIAYDSALRWQRSTRFFAERGMAIDDRLTTLTPDGKDSQSIPVKRHFHNVGGMETLSELVADTTPEIVWRNPFRAYYMDDEMIAVADCLMSLVRAIREDCPPEYGACQARLDQEVVLAMHASAQQDGAPIRLTAGSSYL